MNNRTVESTSQANGAGPRKEHVADRSEPIAIIGIGCRLPGGANSPAAFWQMLLNGEDAIGDIPADRWSQDSFFHADPEAPGKTYARWGGFLDDIAGFDAPFFSIAPREAAYMDPQQRLLLMVTWEALEDAGQVAEELSGSDTGVFVGISTHDYGDLQTKDIYSTDFYANTGGALSIAANRISYSYNFRGPSLSVDTACSSSLVAAHLACNSLWNNECKMAVVAGVNCIISPETTITFSKGSMLSPDGRCKAFDADANGYVRGEGCGAVLLKPWRQAQADGDRIYGVIRATAVNSDGKTNGMTVPNPVSQEALLRDAYSKAQVVSDQVLYVEAHGTGTPVGDPIEAVAIGSVLGRGRSAGNHLRIGSVKSNIGHLEAASGIAGLIKAALLLRHRTIPASLHFQRPNPKISFDELRLSVQHTIEAFPEGNGNAVVGVNSFGFGGTNAHVVLQEVRQAPPATIVHDPGAAKRDFLIPLSARNSAALLETAKAYEALLNDSQRAPVRLEDICFTTCIRRSHHEHRAAFVASSTDELIAGLQAFSSAVPPKGAASGAAPHGGKIAFVLSGMGPQWWAMGRELMAAEPVFKRTLEKCDELFRQHSHWSLLQELASDEEHSRLQEAEVAQPAHFALQIALAALWEAWGIKPEGIVGHSAGELAASTIAGALSLEDATCAIFHRSRLQQQATGKGRMLAIGLSAPEANLLLAEYGSTVSVAAVNSPSSVTLAGDADALEAIAATLLAREVFARFLDVKVPYHSHHMDPIQAELLQSLREIKPRTAAIPFYSTVTGARADGAECDAAYWWSNVRDSVSFAPAIEQLLSDGYRTFVEIGAHPVLSRSILEICAHQKESATVLTSLRRESERHTMLESLGALYRQGRAIQWRHIAPTSGSMVELPKYSWQNEKHWHEAGVSHQHRLQDRLHPLLERRLDLARPTWETNLSLQSLPYLADHCVQDSVVYPAAAYIEMAIVAALESGTNDSVVVEDIELERALVVGKEEVKQIQLVLDESQQLFTIHSRSRLGHQDWTLHVTGSIGSAESRAPVEPPALSTLQLRCTQELSKPHLYKIMGERGLQYGPHFQGIESLWYGQDDALARIEAPEGVRQSIAGYRLHPALLDASFQGLVGAIFFGADPQSKSGVYLPVRVGRIHVHQRLQGSALWSYARVVRKDANSVEGEIFLFDADGNVVVEITGFKCQRLADANSAESLNRLFYEMRWYAKALPSNSMATAAAHFPASSQIAAQVPQPELLSSQFNRKYHYEKVEPQIEKLCASFALEALEKLGWKPQPGDVIEASALADQLGVAAQHRLLFARLLEILAEEGILERSAEGWKLGAAEHLEDAGQMWSRLQESYPDYTAVLTMLGRCGSQLASVLHGDQEPLQLVFPDASIEGLQQLYEESPLNLVYNHIVELAIRQIVESVPKHRSLRVLEIGAGTGGTTAHVLPLLPQDRTEYVFSDMSTVFTEFGARRFADYPFVDFRALDIEQGPARDDFSPHSFDLILASNVLHATKDMRSTLTNIHALLAAGGFAVIMEITRASRTLDLVFGLLKDWWRFEDEELRGGSHPWLSRPVWEAVLQECGFDDVTAISDSRESGEPFQSVFVARAGKLEQATPQESNTTARGAGDHWLVLADRRGVGQRLAAKLQERGDIPVLAFAGETFAPREANQFEIRAENADDMMAVFESIKGKLKGIIHLWSLDVPMPENPLEFNIGLSQELGCESTLNLVQTMARATRPEQARLWLVTCEAQSIVPSSFPNLGQSLVVGLGRVISNEQPDMRCTLVDLDSSIEFASEALLKEIDANDVEQEVAWREGVRYVPRIVRPHTVPAIAKAREFKGNGKPRPFKLEISKPGLLDSFLLRHVPRQKPRSQEVEIEVVSVGLNFRDVMKALGMYPDEEGEGLCLGDEFSGRIVSIGSDVKEWQVGDEVVSIAPGSLRKFVTIPTHYLFPKPKHLTFAEASTIPIVFMTTHYALNHVARLARGERILIQAAAGGVGLAAIQIAQDVGAEIFATAGTHEKREFVRSLGVKHVMDSRSHKFVDEVLQLTDGQGVSVVLNSLAGEFIRSGLAVLEATGRFIELGKIDIYQGNKLNLAHFKKGLSFASIDLGWLMPHRPQISRAVFAEVMEMFAAGRLRPLPVTSFPISDAASGFRHMAQAKQIGKIAFSLQEDHVEVCDELPGPPIRQNATYVISGGLGGFGLAIGQWLVDQGASHLVLLGRSGVASPETEQALANMRAAGAEIRVAKVDVCQLDQVRDLVREIGSSMPTLRGVIHAAMVLDDGYLTQLDAERFQRVVAPKVAGAWNLHTATLDQSLDFFVSFSSVSSLTGSPGQANYCAANSFLDAFAHYRRARKLPALTINWGAIAAVGYVSRNPDVGRYLERQGIEGIKPPEATAALDRLLRGDSCQVAAIRGNIQKLATSFTLTPGAGRFSQIIRQESFSAAAKKSRPDRFEFLNQIHQANREEQFDLMQSVIRQGIATVLKASLSQIEYDQPLASLGLDSLMAVELELLIEEELGMDLSMGFLAGGGVTVRQLIEHVLKQFLTKAAA